jgi:hypothetical protein
VVSVPDNVMIIHDYGYPKLRHRIRSGTHKFRLRVKLCGIVYSIQLIIVEVTIHHASIQRTRFESSVNSTSPNSAITSPTADEVSHG